MKTAPFAADLARFGPTAQQPVVLTLRKSRRYCRRLARRHYENFTAASLLLPRHLRQHFCNIYAYCRWADDLADEVGDPQQSLALLRWWERLVYECYQGQATHPVFVALADTVRRFAIPIEPFLDLLVAFRQDQQVTRYETFGDLLNYCHYSANPVGRLVLYLAECFTPERARLSDAVCTGLQLANFWQDVARDYDQGRIYLPQVDCRHYQFDESAFAGRKCTEGFRRLMAAMVVEAEACLRRGLPLATKAPEEFQLPIALFAHGGLTILASIRGQNYDVWSKRPTVSFWEKLWLGAVCWWKLRRGTLLEELHEDHPDDAT
jgi:squalene synthase HpnC